MNAQCYSLLVPGILLLIVSTPNNAFAYIDPGTGSFLLQSSVAIIFGTIFFFKKNWLHIKGYFQTKKLKATQNLPVERNQE